MNYQSQRFNTISTVHVQLENSFSLELALIKHDYGPNQALILMLHYFSAGNFSLSWEYV